MRSQTSKLEAAVRGREFLQPEASLAAGVAQLIVRRQYHQYLHAFLLMQLSSVGANNAITPEASKTNNWTKVSRDTFVSAIPLGFSALVMPGVLLAGLWGKPLSRSSHISTMWMSRDSVEILLNMALTDT